VRYGRYLTFLLTVQAPDGSGLNEEGEAIQGKMYTETSLFRIVALLDQLITLSSVSAEGYSIAQKFFDPENLRQIIELSVETTTQNQILIQKILQHIMRLGLPQEILDESVKLAGRQ